MKETLEQFFARGGTVTVSAPRRLTMDISRTKFAERRRKGCPHCREKLKDCRNPVGGLFSRCVNEACPARTTATDDTPEEYYYVSGNCERVWFTSLHGNVTE